ncbi:MAG: DNA ligase [Limnohabitans sp.]
MHHATPRALGPFFTRRHGLQWLAALPFWPQAQAKPTGVQLASDWPLGRSPQGFLVSEKFDGVRAVWDSHQLRFRSGRDIVAPDWFVRALPDHPLDGELWLGHGQFDRLSGVVRQQQPDEAGWRAVRYLVFDAPGGPGSFESRWQALQPVIEAANQSWLQRVEQFRLDDSAALRQRLEAVFGAGGEGLVLHRADALWRSGRSDALFKFKPAPDAEAQVVGHLPGKGRYAGLTGALRVRTPDDRYFELGSGLSDVQRRNPPELGSWVTYRYRDHTPNGVPRFATFVRPRPSE